MILRSVRVEGWRKLAMPIALRELSEGVNVIHAPNGTGKSTLLEALRRGLLDNHRMRGAEVDALRPWGTRVPPCVTIEFAHAGHEYRLSKQFLDEPAAKLLRFDGRGFQPYRDGEEATLTVRRMFAADDPAKGPGNWCQAGLLHALWSPQEGLALQALTDEVKGELQQRLGVQFFEASADWERRLQAQYERFFTDTGRLRSGKGAPSFVQRQQQLAELRDRHIRSQAAWDEFHAASSEVDRLRVTLDELQRSETALDVELQSQRAATLAVAELRRRRAEQEQRRLQAQQDFDRRFERDERLKRIALDVQAQTKRFETAAAREPELRQAVERVVEDLRAADALLERLRESARAAEVSAEQSRQAQRFAGIDAEYREINERLSRLADLEREIHDARSAADVHAKLDRTQLERVRQAHAQRAQAAAQLSIVSLRVELTPEQDAEIEVTAGTTESKHQVQAGRSIEFQGEAEIVVNWPGVGQIRVSGPREAVDAARRNLSAADEELAQLRNALGSDDLELLASRLEQAEALRMRITAQRMRREDLLERQSLDAWNEQRASISRQRDELLEEFPDGLRQPPDVDAMPAGDAIRAEKARRAIDEAANVREALQRRRFEASSALQAATNERQQAENELTRLAAEQTEHTQKSAAEPAERSPGELAMAVHVATAGLAEIDQQLAAFTDDPVARVTRLEAEQSQHRQQQHQSRDVLRAAEERLRLRGDEAPHSALAALEEEIAALEDEIARGKREADAVRLLRQTYQACRGEFTAEVSRTLESAVRDHVNEIFDRDPGELRLSDRLVPESVAPPALAADMAEAGQSAERAFVEITRLSGGEQEQIHLAVRLAMAETLASTERQVVVLDDVLTATDPERMARIVRMLARLSEHLQIVILTCDLERYRGFESAKWFDLAAEASHPACGHLPPRGGK